MAITRGTSPWILFTLPIEIKREQIKEAWLTVSQDKRPVTTKKLTEDELAVDDETSTIGGHLSQVDTLLLSPDKITETQMRFIDTSNESYATEIITYNTYDVLQEGVIG